MPKNLQKVGLLHYSAPPVVGGVENIILAHARLFKEVGYSITVLAGRVEKDALPLGAELIYIPELDSQRPQILEMSHELDQGHVPTNFEQMAAQIVERLAPVFSSIDFRIVHNVFTKHFNLPLTAALFRLLDQGAICRCVAWHHGKSLPTFSSIATYNSRFLFRITGGYASMAEELG